MTLLRAVARSMLASLFVLDGTRSLKDPESLADQAKPVTDRIVPVLQRVAPGAPIPTNPATWVRINGAVNVAGAAMLASGRFPRVAATILAANIVPATLADHPFWKEADPRMRSAQRLHFAKNMAVAGGLLMTAVSGKPATAKSKKAAG